MWNKKNESDFPVDLYFDGHSHKKISHKLLLPLSFIFVNMTVNYKSLYDDVLLEAILLDGRISWQEPLSLFPVLIDSTLRLRETKFS